MQLKRAVLVLLLFVSPAFAQWHPQKSNTDTGLHGLSIVNGNVVWVSGTGGTFVRTTDGGETWQAGTVVGSDSCSSCRACACCVLCCPRGIPRFRKLGARLSKIP